MQFPHHHHHQLLLYLFLLATTAAAAGDLTPTDEVRSLLEFKKGISEDPLNKILDSWNTPTSDPEKASFCSLFYGISGNENGFVSAVNLDHLDLSGDLKFVTLYNLKFHKNLSLSGNRFKGRIVPVIGSMYSLQYLDMSANQFYGPIPEKINDLYGLSYLNLSSNNFSGGFPNGIQNLQQLAMLDLHSKSLWGDLGDLSQ